MNSVHASSHTNLQFYTWILLYVISGMNSYVGPLAFSQGQPLLHMNSAYVISCMNSYIGPLYILTGPASAAAHLIFSEELQVALGDPYPALDGNQGKHGSYRIQSNSGRVAKSTPYLEYKCEHQAKWCILNAQIAMPVARSCVSWISAFHFRNCLSLDELWFFKSGLPALNMDRQWNQKLRLETLSTSMLPLSRRTDRKTPFYFRLWSAELSWWLNPQRLP